MARFSCLDQVWMRKDREVVLAAVAQNGHALRYVSAELKAQYGDTPDAFLAAAALDDGSGAAGAANDNDHDANDDADVQPPAAKRPKPNPTLEAKLQTWMAKGDSVNNSLPQLLPLDQSAYLRQYDKVPPPRCGEGLWSTPIAAVARSRPSAFRDDVWEEAFRTTRDAHVASSPLAHAGAACAYMWSKTPMCRLVQRTILADDEEALERLMPYIKCLNAFILDQQGLLPRKTRTYRTSRMSKAQADPIQPGDKYRLGMYVATSTRKGAISDLTKRTENRRRDGREVPNSVVEQKYKKNGKFQLVSQWVFSMSFKITKVKLLFLG